MQITHHTVNSNGNKLAATIVLPEGQPKAALIRIGGGYMAGHWPNNWQASLAEQGIASIGFDFPGVGDSTGSLNETSLTTRFEDARNVIKYFKTQLDSDLELSILGVSMGAPIAIWLAEELKFNSLVIAVPAAYPKSSYTKNFGDDFSKEIRIEGAWKSSDEFKKLVDLSTPTLLISAKQDEIIPREIIDRYSEILKLKNQPIFEFDAPHAFLRENGFYPELAKEFWETVAGFIFEDNKG